MLTCMMLAARAQSLRLGQRYRPTGNGEMGRTPCSMVLVQMHERAGRYDGHPLLARHVSAASLVDRTRPLSESLS